MRALLVAAAGVALAAPAVAAGYASFRAPGRTVYCELGEIKPAILVCWRARDGRSIGMLPMGRALVNPDTNTRNLRHDRAPILAFGETWRGGAYRCTSRRAGVTCRNRSGHGWFLGRSRGYRLF
jgi:Family of unknown function (DUF6636)